MKRFHREGPSRGFPLAAQLSLSLVLLGPVAAVHADGTREATPIDQDDDGDDGVLYVLGALLVGAAAASPWWAPPWILNDNFGKTATFYEHPYDGQTPGYLHLDGEPSAPTSVWAATLSTDYGFDSDADRFGSRLTIDTSSRFGIDAEWNQISGDDSASVYPEFQTGDFNFTLRFAQDPHVQFRTGMGFRWLSDDLDTNYGINFLYGVDILPLRPLVLSTLVEVGALRHEAFVHGRASVGLNWSHVEVFAGFDYLQIDNQEIAGPMIGVRLWL